MSLKYKLDDEVVLGEKVGTDLGKYFVPGALVRIDELCREGIIEGEHYTIRRVDGKGGDWWVEDFEINHEATEKLHMLNKARDTVQFTGLAELLQKSNEIGDIVRKIEAVSDDNTKEVRTPSLVGSDENEWFKRGELPPVGTVCECQNNSMQWLKGTIVYVGEDNGTTLAIMQTSTEILYGEAGEFRPIKSPEQIAAEEREEAIQKMVSCAGERMSFRSICASLYDAGLRFVGEDK